MAWPLPSTPTSSQVTPASLTLSVEATSPSAQNIFPSPLDWLISFYFPGLALNIISASLSLTSFCATSHTRPTPIFAHILLIDSVAIISMYMFASLVLLKQKFH